MKKTIIVLVLVLCIFAGISLFFLLKKEVPVTSVSSHKENNVQEFSQKTESVGVYMPASTGSVKRIETVENILPASPVLEQKTESVGIYMPTSLPK